MNRKLLYYVVFSVAVRMTYIQSLYCQTNGITFTNNLTWEEIKSKAKVEKKFIFLDCSATWCVPCKMMVKDVFCDPIVAKLVNPKFISVQVQMNKTDSDSYDVKRWYRDAMDLQKQAHVDAYPTYLFFDSNGILIHRGSAYQKANDFIRLVKTAIDSTENNKYWEKKYLAGDMADNLLGEFAIAAKRSKQFVLADSAAMKFKRKYLDRIVDTNVLLTAANLNFVRNFPYLISSRDNLFKLMIEDPHRVDSTINLKGFSKSMITNIVTEEDINSKIYLNKGSQNITPNWRILEKEISKKIDRQTRQVIVLNAKIQWYTSKQDWAKVVKYNIEKVDKMGYDSSRIGLVLFNNMIFNVIFKHADNKKSLKTGIGWIKSLLQKQPETYQWRDTYANLLYKVRNRKSAIMEEQLAIDTINRKIQEKGKKDYLLRDLADFSNTIGLMRMNKPTW